MIADDSRYYGARKAGVSHSAAWAQEKKRRRATLSRQQGTGSRARERINLDKKWHRSFDSGQVKDEEYQNDILEGVETEGVEDIGGGKVRVLTGDARVAKKSQLRQADQTKFVQAARRYRSLTQAEVSRFKVETKEDEAKVMEKNQKKLERKQRVAAAKKRRTVCRSMVWHGKCKDGDKCKFDHDVAKYEKANLCPQFIHGHCRRLTKCKMNHDAVEREICRILKRQKKVKRKKSEAQTGQKGASRTSGPADSDSGGSAMEQEDAKNTVRVRLIEAKDVKNTVRLVEAKDVKSTVRLVEAKDVKDPSSFEAPYAGQGEWISMNFDTGAAVTAIPKKLSDYSELKGDPNSSSYKTASGELLPDEGGAVTRGYTNDCCSQEVRCRRRMW